MRSGWMHCDNGDGQERFAPKTTIAGVEGLTEAKAGYDAHLTSKNNPHGVTAEQVGAATTTDVKAAVQTARAVNLLDNSDFTRPVNQRGVSGTISTAGYFLDRWKLVSGSVSIGANGITLNGTISQILERAPSGTVTAASSAGTASFEASSKTYSLSAAGELITWAALYEGSYTAATLPPYVPKGYTAEMLACKRYCRVIDWGTTRYTGFFGAATSGTTAVYAILPIDVPMRVTPSLSSTAGTNFRLYGGDVSFNPTSVSVWFAGNNAIGLVFACTAVAGRVYVVYPATGTPIVLSADL